MAPTQASEPPSWDDFPRPSLAVDVTVLTVERGTERPRLALLVIRRETSAHQGAWDIPGAFVQERERLGHAVDRVLRDKAGVTGLVPRQLGVFDEPDRDDRGWVVSVAYTVSVPFSRLQPALGRNVRLAPLHVSTDNGGAGEPRVRVALPSSQKHLPFDHDEIVRRAVEDLQERYRRTPDPDRLVESDEFTLTELYAIHSLINAGEEHRDTFRRRVEPRLSEVGVRRLAVGRPAKLYTFERD